MRGLRKLRGAALAAPLGLRRGFCAAHLLVIALLSLLPAWLFPPAPAGVPGMDKVVHLAMYGLLGALLRWTADPNSLLARSWRLPLAGMAYGLLMEVGQWALPGVSRSFSWGDILANAIGVVLFWKLAGRVLAPGRSATD